MNFADKNSDAAADYAAKKRSMLAKANELRKERELLRDNLSLEANIGVGVVGQSSFPPSSIQAHGPNVSITSYGNTCERIVISNVGSGMRQKIQPASGRVTSLRQRQVLDKARESREITSSIQSMQISNKNVDTTIDAKPEAPSNLVSRSLAVEEAALVETFPSMQSGFVCARSCNASISNSEVYLSPPMNPQGHMFDVSDRPLMCSSCNMRNEVVVGGTDHGVYSIDFNDFSKKPLTMYSKRFGHSDWVTSVSHLADGRVVSVGMDSQVCLWALDRRSCMSLSGHDKSISKIVSDTRFNLALSCGYDLKAAVWSFGDSSNQAISSSSSSSGKSSAAVSRTAIRSRTTGSSTANVVPVGYLVGQGEPLLECTFRDNIAATGSRTGSLFLWDLTSLEVVRKYAAHKGQVTALDSCYYNGESSDQASACFLSGGSDGTVKLWDARDKSGAIVKLAPHIEQITTTTTAPAADAAKRGGVKAIANPIKSSSAMSRSAASSSSSSSTVSEVRASAVSFVSSISSRGSSGSATYVVSGGADSDVVVSDIRRKGTVARWTEGKIGIYSLCVVGDRCILVGDGSGMLLVYDLLDNSGGLKYGIGASSSGAVKTINCANGKIVTSGEDGKVLAFSYN